MLNTVDMAEQFIDQLSNPYLFLRFNLSRIHILSEMFADWHKYKTNSYINAINNLSEVKEDINAKKS